MARVCWLLEISFANNVSAEDDSKLYLYTPVHNSQLNIYNVYNQI